jgi:hypothetical protein
MTVAPTTARNIVDMDAFNETYAECSRSADYVDAWVRRAFAEDPVFEGTLPVHVRIIDVSVATRRGFFRKSKEIKVSDQLLIHGPGRSSHSGSYITSKDQGAVARRFTWREIVEPRPATQDSHRLEGHALVVRMIVDRVANRVLCNFPPLLTVVQTGLFEPYKDMVWAYNQVDDVDIASHINAIVDSCDKS